MLEISCILMISTLCFGQEDMWKSWRLVHDNHHVATVPLSSKSPLTQTDLLRVALHHNPKLFAQLEIWKSALHKIRPSKQLANPKLSYSHYIHEVETRVGPQKNAYGLSQHFPFPGTLGQQGKQALEQAKQAQQQFRQTQYNLIYQVKKHYYDYVYLLNAIRITEQNETLLRNLETVAQTKYKSGIAKNQDLLKAQVELGKIANDLMALKDYKPVVIAQIKALLNWPTEQTFM